MEPTGEVAVVRLKDFSDLRVAKDGSKTTVRLNTVDGDAADIEIETEDVGRFIAYLCGIAAFAKKTRKGKAIAPVEEEIPVYGIEAEGTGFATIDGDLRGHFPWLADRSDEALPAAMIVRMSGFDLAFQMGDMPVADTPGFLRRSADRLDRLLRARAGRGKNE